MAELTEFHVYTPVHDWTGDVGKVHFEHGKAVVSNEAMELHHMVQNGYRITDQDGVDIEDPLARLIGLAAGVVDLVPAAMPVRIVADDTTDEDDEDIVRKDVDGDGTVDELPKKSATVGEWRKFATDHGMSEDEAGAMTRDALVTHYNIPKEG